MIKALLLSFFYSKMYYIICNTFYLGENIMDYPDWVLKHKQKGTYINRVGGKYYLYKAHSERIPGTKKVKRVCDGYLGRITEKDGLIPPKEKISSDILVYEYGLCFSIMQICENIYKGFKKTSPRNADFIIVSSILTIINGCSNSIVFHNSYLSIIFPHLNMSKVRNESIETNVMRGVAMINDTLNKLMGENRTVFFNTLSGLYKIRLNDKWYLSKEDSSILAIQEKYQLKWGNSDGKDV